MCRRTRETRAEGIGELRVFGEISGDSESFEAVSKADRPKLKCRREESGEEKQ
jgi:hypothetical protein